MTDLIVVENEEVKLSQNAIDTIYNFEQQMKELKAKQAKMKENIKNEMEARGIKGIKTDLFSISYVEEYDTIKLDSKMLKEKYPDIADECSKISHTKSQVKFTFKK